jgi:uncharacterized protein YigA (DUF484 family)
MFGYRLIKTVEIENLRTKLADSKEKIGLQAREIVELNDKIRELENTIAKFNEAAKVNNEIKEEKPIKKVRRKSSKKTTKKEE